MFMEYKGFHIRYEEKNGGALFDCESFKAHLEGT